MSNPTLRGSILAEQGAFAVVVSRFNDVVTSRLLESCCDTLRAHGASDNRITVVWVPGSFEIPFAANQLARTGKFSAVICLGAVIQGETTHHECINHEVARGIGEISLSTGIPVAYGVLACSTLEQALNRAGGKAGNKGSEAALAAIEMANLARLIREKTFE